jgi:hypothetical protein
MDKQVTVTLPDQVYDQMQQIAEADQRSVADVLVEAIVRATPALYVHPDRQAMLQEKAAFLAMHSTLLRSYEGQYVALHQGQVIDHDEDVLTLGRRVSQDHRNKIVLIKKVLEQPDRILEFRSPRLVRTA